MRLRLLLYAMVVALMLMSSTLCIADVDWSFKTELNFKNPPVDMAVSRDAQWLYVLTEDGHLLVYTFDHQLKGKIPVGIEFEKIISGPSRDIIYLLSRKGNKIRILEANPSQQIDISGSPYKGAIDAPVVITEFTDFQCPYCAKLGEIFNRLLKQYPEKLKIVYKSYPLANHRYAWKAATNAMAAHQKGKFWEFHDRLFENHKTLDDNKIMEIRKTLGFDTPEFDAIMGSPQVRSQVALDRSEGQRLGVRGTPTVFINGKRLKDKSLEGLQAAIEKELNTLRK
ncbi:MAG: thioredoxin domain-containing protein [Desulfobacteraceae bacterium]